MSSDIEQPSSSDSQSQNSHSQPVNNLHDSYYLPYQNTQASFLVENNEMHKTLSVSFTKTIRSQISTMRVDKSEYMKPFIEYLNKDKRDIKVEILKNDMFNLDCVPILVLVDTDKTSLKDVYKWLKSQNSAAKIVLNMDEKKISYKNYITFQPEVAEPFYFKIKELPLFYSKDKEADILIDKLFEFHLNVISNFNDFAGYIFFWADTRRILSERYLSVGVLKLILVLFLTVNHVPDFIQEYRKKYSDQLNKADQYIEIGPKGAMIANKQEINKFPNALVETRKGFFLKSEGTYDESCVIHKIPFPMLEININEMVSKFKKESSDRFLSRSIGEWVYIFFKFAKSLLSVKKTLKIDLAEIKGKKWGTKDDADATLIVIHPVFGHNMTEHLKKSRKTKVPGSKQTDDYETICKEFERAFQFVKTGELKDLVDITNQFQD